MSNRDDFPDGIKRVVAQRAAYFCNRPECRRLTIGPASDPVKSLSSGVAAHVCAAAPGGPRFDPKQTEEERKNIENAIWLCHTCSDLVDKDERQFPKELLHDWKTRHHEFILGNGGVPRLPDITLKTLGGLTLPSSGPAIVRGEDVATYREHVLAVANVDSRVLHWLRCRIQFPEPIAGHRIVERPPGSSVECQADRMELTASAMGGGSVTVSGNRPALDYRLAIDILPPRSKIVLRFLSVALEDSGEGRWGPTAEEGLVNHILGQFQYPLLGEYVPREFLVPLDYDSDRRTITSLPCEENDGSRRILYCSSW
jgi:hypothetical protein